MNDGKTQHTRQRDHCDRRDVQSGAGTRTGSAFQLPFRNSGHGAFSHRVPSSQSSSRSLCRGALSTAFVTVFSQKIEKDGPSAAWDLASKMLTLATVFMSAISLLGIVFAGPLVRLLAPGFDPADAGFTILLTQIMYPFILLVSLAALVMGALNSRQIFTAPAMASSFFNIGSIAGGVIFGWLIDRHFGRNALIGLAVGTLVGGLLQLLVQLPSLRRAGFRFKPDFRWKDEGIQKSSRSWCLR